MTHNRLTLALAALALATTITIDVPRGQWLHAYPEAGAGHSTIRWRCTSSRRWQPARDGGWPVPCRTVILTGSVVFDAGAEPAPQLWAPR